MGLNYNPSIVVDGLQYALDVANSKCYSGSGNTTFDLTGRVAPGALVNGPTYNINLNGFFSFDGTNDYINCGNILDNLSNFTVAAWVKTTSSVMQMVVAKLVNYSSGAGWALFLHPTLGISIVLQTNGSVWIVYSSNKKINDNSWHYISAIINNKIVTAFYVDGISYPVTSQGQGTVTNYSNGIDVRIARNEANEYIFQGDISQAHLYSKSLSAAEILQNYNANRGRYSYNVDIVTNGLTYNIDAGNYLSYPTTGNIWYGVGGSGSTYYSVLTNGPTYSGSGSTGIISFDGTNDYATVDTNLLSGYTSGSIATFIKFSGSNPYGTIFLRQHGGVNTYNAFTVSYQVTGFGDRTAGTTGRLYYQNQNNDQKIQSISLLSSNVWYYVVLTFSSTNAKIYINGRLDNTVNGNFSSPADLVTDPRIASYSGFEYLSASVSSFQFYNRALSQSEVIQNYDVFRGRF